MAHHEELADRCATQHDEQQHDPVVFVHVGEAVVVAQHRKQHRQREVGVVHAALFAAYAVRRVHRFAFAQGRHVFALAGDDPEKHVATHGGGHHRADQQKGGAAGEPLAGQPSRKGHQQRHKHTDDGVAVLAAAEDLADAVVGDPEHNEKGQRHRDGRTGLPVHLGLVDEVGAGVPQIGHGEQRKTAEPGGVTLPVRPVQVVRQLLGRQRVLLHVVEATAVDGPLLTAHPFVQRFLVVWLLQAVVQHDEVEGGTDPGDGGDDVNPTQ